MQVNLYKKHTYMHPYQVISSYSWLQTRGREYKIEFPYTNELLIKAQFQNLTARKGSDKKLEINTTRATKWNIYVYNRHNSILPVVSVKWSLLFVAMS